MNWLTKNLITHRGLHNGNTIPENSLSAFNEAIKKGYSIELDVRLTKDNQVVVFHDRYLNRLSNYEKEIHDMTYNDLKEFKLYESNESIPLLKEVLDFINARVPILIDIKDYEKVGIFEEQICKVLKEYKGVFAVCSFNPKVVSWFTKNKPAIKKGMIFGDLEEFEMQDQNLVFLYRYLKLKPDFVSIDYKLINSFIINICKFFEVPLITWTIKDKDLAQELLEKVDNIIFEKF